MIVGLIAGIAGCKKMDRTFKDFVVPGGLVYAEKASSPLVYAGYNRVKISWLRGADPNVTRARIYWDNYEDSVDVDIPPAADTINTLIDNLPEKPYTFIVITYDDKGNASVPVELHSASYGEKYQSRILSRPVNVSLLHANGTLTLQWGGADISNGAYATDVNYTDTLGGARSVRIPATEAVSDIADINTSKGFEYRTVFLPDSLCIDTFYTDFQKNGLLQLDKKDWKVIAFSTEHPGAENMATNVIDGKPETRWHTWVDHSTYPHFVTVDMGGSHAISTFEIFRMKDDDRACNTFRLEVSTDTTAGWTDLGVFDFNRNINDGQRYTIPTHPQGRYFRFTGLTGPLAYMVTGEITVYPYTGD
ncbi:hypothetical protein GCM10023143_30940 [Compostibacter hankyongensis]|uniref:F5/8 type C domain-containing protein n=2 Tax=Compostibacter hankyongensis TaxID=1007089 RepID=A0ABP8G677_9BACT